MMVSINVGNAVGVNMHEGGLEDTEVGKWGRV